MVALSIFKMHKVEEITTSRIGVDEINFGILALKHDLIIFATLLLFFVLSVVVRSNVVAMVMRFIIIMIVLAWMSDIFILSFFAIRLEYLDILKFLNEIDAISAFVYQIFNGARMYLVLLPIAVFLLFMMFVLTKVKLHKKVSVFFLALITMILGGVFVTSDSTSYVHQWVYENVYEINLDQGISERYSVEYVAELDKLPNPLVDRDFCISGQSQRSNVIILLFESLSMYHSTHFSGLPTLMPNFDRIAKENTSYINFFSNGFTTEAGMISVLTGKHMFPPLADFQVVDWGFGFGYHGFYQEKGSLPDIFNQNDYFTAFTTTGDLNFLNKGLWLRSIGFDYVEGSEQFFYDSWPRFSFNAPADEALYQRVLSLLSDFQQRSPFMLTIETVSTHQPFFNPENGEKVEHSVFLYADRQLGVFYDALRASDFFDDGMLVIVGDHRSMTGIRSEELEIYGNTASARVPMVIAFGNGHEPGIIDTLHQQTDFIPSFEYLVGSESCASPLAGIFLSEPAIEAKYVLFPRGDDRDLVDIYTAQDEWATIRIKGDSTSVINGSINFSLNDVTKHIGKERMRVARSTISERASNR
jgi:lipoteichoic acid synthase